MATRSRIAMQNEDGTISSIYCHWDGYPSHNGEILKENYKDPAKVKALMELGSLSILGAELGEKQDFDDRESQIKGACLAYGRDRGETGVEAKVSESLDQLVRFTAGSDQEYLYLFENGEWKYLDMYHVQSSGWKSL